VQLYRIALSGAESYDPVLIGERSCLLLGTDGEQQALLYVVSTLNSPTELYIADIEGGNERRLTQLNDDLLSQIALPTVENLRFPSADGTEVEGWILKPAVGETPYPTVLYIHGGPFGAHGHAYSFDFQLLCGAGYATLTVNYRASMGYGDAFSTPMAGKWGTIDYQDLMAGVDTAIARGISDPERLGVAGLSFGGFHSCWIITQTDRFKAAVPENPVVNWLTEYGVSDCVWYVTEEMGGHPWEIPEVYRDCSPLTYAHQCKTPTLLLQGEHDWRCPTPESEQFYTALKAAGCPVEMVRFPSSYHAGSIRGAVAVRRAQNEALLDWMNRYVLGKAPRTDIV
jgi:dipeptidyl aminopeptidase/acylaminoacyl peptidase